MELNVTMDDLRKYSIFLGTPMYGGQCTGLYTRSTNDLSAVCAKHGVSLRSYYLFNESLVQRARNYVVDEFLRSDSTHLLFVDSDIGFNVSDVFTLLAVYASDPEKYNIVTGPYPKKVIAWEKVLKAAKYGKADEDPKQLSNYTADYVFNPISGKNTFSIGEPLEVSEAGTGFMLIPRETLEKYREAYPELSYKPDHIRTEHFDGSREITAYFDCAIDPETKRYLSEDYFFCWNARKAGMSVYMCPWMNLKHAGSYTFEGNMQALAEISQEDSRQESKKKAPKKKNLRRK